MRLFNDFDTVAEKYNVKLTDRPQRLTVDKFLMIIKEYEKNLN